ncbi:phosphatase PAP2 family protein [Amycolatopsis pittospori]|uniref:phosphatase PAP2 family protein n=1 Tax=Amycolatopsis pittospori TaxID=2749434 RepID=UPI0015F03EF6|nr:phosphatase PAP2 family protein [Amycolatopsis pittospori]
MVSLETRRKTPGRSSWALFSALGFLALYALSNLTPFGQRAENLLLDGTTDQTLIYEVYRTGFLPALSLEYETMAVGIGAAVLIAAWRRRWRDLATVIVATPVAVYSTRIFKDAAPRPDLVGAVHGLTERSYPSGHFAVAAAVSVALLIVVPRTWLRWVAPVLLSWTSAVGGAVLTMMWHRPSDVLGGALLVAAVFLLAGAVLSKTTEEREKVWRPSVPVVVVGIGITVASAWRDPYTWTVPFSVVTAVLATAFLGYVALRCRTES